MGGMGQLVKGVFIGVVLILAIIGTMSILDKNPADDKNSQNSNVPANQTAPVSDVPAPTISVTNPNSPIPDPSPTDSNPKISLNDDSFKPTLENEKTAEELKEEAEKKEPKPLMYGMLRLASIDFETRNSLKASYAVFDKNDKKIAESLNKDQAAFRLPVGQYKVVSTLSVASDTTRKTEPVQSTQFINIVADTVVQKLFKMEPPSTIGVLQVSARDAKSNRVIRAGFIVQKENGETVAERQNVTNTLFKLKAGSYKVTVRSGENSDFRTVVIEAGESAKEVFMLQEASRQGRVLVRVFDTFSNQPVPADITITSSSGTIVQKLKSVPKAEISLAEGSYNILVAGPYGQSKKDIQVVAGRAISEVFRFDAKDKTESKNESQITENVKISPVKVEDDVATSTTTTTPSTEPTALTGSLQLFAQSDNNKSPIKSNFYVQTLTGQHINRKIYSDSAVFKLKPGSYKITVRAKGKKNIVRNIKVSAGQNIRQVFSLRGVKQSSKAPTSPASNTRTPSLGGVKPAKNGSNTKTISNGFLEVAMQPAQNTHFIISNQSGKKIVELTSVPNGRFKLDTGVYNVTAILNGQRRSKAIRVNQGRTSKLAFSSNNFQNQKQTNKDSLNGILRSRIVDQAGRPLKGNLVVTNLQGRVITRANNVSVGVFRLPPRAHIVTVNYKGLQGSERVRIITGETTMQTFTIAP